MLRRRNQVLPKCRSKRNNLRFRVVLLENLLDRVEKEVLRSRALAHRGKDDRDILANITRTSSAKCNGSCEGHLFRLDGEVLDEQIGVNCRLSSQAKCGFTKYNKCETSTLVVLGSLELGGELFELDADTGTPVHKEITNHLTHYLWMPSHANILQQRLHQSLADLLLSNRTYQLEQCFQRRTADSALYNLAERCVQLGCHDRLCVIFDKCSKDNEGRSKEMKVRGIEERK
jgi:hypothetical protein